VQAQTAGQFPDALDGVQFGTVGRQKVQRKFRSVLFPPSQVSDRLMVSGVIADDHHPTLQIARVLPSLPGAARIKALMLVPYEGYSAAVQRSMRDFDGFQLPAESVKSFGVYGSPENEAAARTIEAAVEPREFFQVAHDNASTLGRCKAAELGKAPQGVRALHYSNRFSLKLGKGFNRKPEDAGQLRSCASARNQSDLTQVDSLPANHSYQE